jgi:transposase
MPPAARQMLEVLGHRIDRLSAEIASLDAKLKTLHKANPVSRLLAEIPGIGPVSSWPCSSAAPAKSPPWRSPTRWPASRGL